MKYFSALIQYNTQCPACYFIYYTSLPIYSLIRCKLSIDHSSDSDWLRCNVDKEARCAAFGLCMCSNAHLRAVTDGDFSYSNR
jgi:hypothetical protein